MKSKRLLLEQFAPIILISVFLLAVISCIYRPGRNNKNHSAGQLTSLTENKTDETASEESTTEEITSEESSAEETTLEETTSEENKTIQETKKRKKQSLSQHKHKSRQKVHNHLSFLLITGFFRHIMEPPIPVCSI